MSRTAIKPFALPEASDVEWAQARSHCADRARARGSEHLAAAFTAGTQDDGFAMRHEIYRLQEERDNADA